MTTFTTAWRYAVFSSKRGILRAIRTAWHDQSHIRDVTVGNLGDQPEERLEQLAQATRWQWETGSEVIAIYNGAAMADPDAAAELSQALEGRRKAMETFALSLEPHLRPGHWMPPTPPPFSRHCVRRRCTVNWFGTRAGLWRITKLGCHRS